MEDIDGEALTACILNTLRGQLQIVAVKVPGFSDKCKLILRSLAILTGGNMLKDKLDIKLERATTDLLGSTRSITITKEDMIVLNGDALKDSI
jgi:chaperonin GroEL